MIFYRLVQDWHGIPEGACITQEKYRLVYYTDKTLFEPVSDYEIPDMFEYVDKDFCAGLGIERVLFYSEVELQKFIDKSIDNGIPN